MTSCGPAAPAGAGGWLADCEPVGVAAGDDEGGPVGVGLGVGVGARVVVGCGGGVLAQATASMATKPSRTVRIEEDRRRLDLVMSPSVCGGMVACRQTPHRPGLLQVSAQLVTMASRCME